VLVVDDNATNRQVAREMLEAWGCQAEEAADGWEALDVLRTAASGVAPIEVAILDFQMPEMDGAQLARALKADASLAATSLLLLTSMPRPGDADAMLALGFEAYLTKPIKASLLRAALATLAAIRRGTRRRPAALITAHSLLEARQVRPRALVVDESPLNRKLAALALEKAGIGCDTAPDAAEALRAASRREYALAFLDCHLADMSASELARRLRALGSGGPGGFVVGMSADIDGEADSGPAPPGLDEMIGKPARAADFRGIAERYVAARQRRTRDTGRVRLVVDNSAAGGGGTRSDSKG
jgi:CheY-like chemotaxis protein